MKYEALVFLSELHILAKFHSNAPQAPLQAVRLPRNSSSLLPTAGMPRAAFGPGSTSPTAGGYTCHLQGFISCTLSLSRQMWWSLPSHTQACVCGTTPNSPCNTHVVTAQCGTRDTNALLFSLKHCKQHWQQSSNMCCLCMDNKYCWLEIPVHIGHGLCFTTSQDTMTTKELLPLSIR